MIAADYTSAIRQILRRLKRDKLESVLREWDAFEKESVTTVLQNKTLKTKKAVVEGLVDLCQVSGLGETIIQSTIKRT